MVALQFARVQACGKAGKPRPVFRASNGAQCRSPSAARGLVTASHADHEASATADEAEEGRDFFLQEEPVDDSLVGRLRTAAIFCLVTAVAIFAPREPALAAEARPPPATSTVVAHAASPAAQAVQASQAAAQARWIASTANAATVRHAPHEVATLAAAAPVEAAPAINGGDTAFVLVCAILVLSMTLPGLAFFYGGLTRVGSLNSMLLQHVAVASVASIVWIAFGYSVAFSTTGMVEGEIGWRSVVGGLDKAFLNGITEGSVVETIPEHLWVMFQMTFAVISPCIMLGACALLLPWFAERMKFKAVMAFTSLWVAIVYVPIAHAVWAGPGALLGDMGALDFAGGLVVHIASGFSGLMAAIMVGPRKNNSLGLHSLPMMMMGTCMLWVGWMGFNAGSALTASAAAASALVNTQACTAVAVITWMLLDSLHGKVSLLGACAGAVTGLVVITPAAGFVGTLGAGAMGIIGVVICRWMVETVKPKLGYDDSLDAFGIHGAGGFVGNLLVGIFASPMFGGNQLGLVIASQCAVQMFAGCLVALYSVVGTWVILKVVSAACGGLRVSEVIEAYGCDQEIKEITAYNA